MIALPLLVAAVAGAAPSRQTDAAPADRSEAAVSIVRALLQVRYRQTAVAVVPRLTELVQDQFPAAVAADTLRTIRDTRRVGDGLSLRRAWLELEAKPLEYLHGELRVDFARLFSQESGDHHVTDDHHQVLEAFVGELTPRLELTLSVGLFEVPFSLFELLHDPEFELAEKGPSHELLEHLRFTGSEVGAMARFVPLAREEWLELYAGVFDGGATDAQTFRGPGLVAGRILGQPVPALRLGAGLVWRPEALDAWFEDYRFRYQASDEGAAYGVDATFSVGDFSLRAEWLAGDRTDNDVEFPFLVRRGEARRFMAFWGMARFRIPLGGMALTPALRGELLDTDREHGDVGGIVHLSAGLNLDLSERWRLMWDLSQHYVQPGTRNWEFDIVRYDTDATSGTLQLQLDL